MRKDDEVQPDAGGDNGVAIRAQHKPDCPELRTGGGFCLIVERMTCGGLPKRREPAIVSNGRGNRYWCRRARSLAASWLELDVFDWIDGYGWDSLPVKRRETLEAIDKSMTEVGL